MAKRTGPTNEEAVALIKELKLKSSLENVKIWKRIAEDLQKPSRNRRIVNLYKINHYAKDDEVVIVPGKVLGVGDLDKKIEIAAFSFSSSAIEKLKKNDSSAMSISELMKKNPKGKKVRILG